MALYRESLPQIYDSSSDIAQNAYRAEGWKREDILRGQTEQKGLEEQLRSMELMAISKGWSLPYEDTTPLPLKIKLIEDMFAKKQYQSTPAVQQPARPPMSSGIPAIPQPAIQSPQITQPIGRPTGGTSFAGTLPRKSTQTPLVKEDSVAIAEAEVKKLGGNPETIYTDKFMFSSGMSKADKLKTLSDWTKKESNIEKQTGKWVDSLIKGMDRMIGETYTLVSGQKYTVDTAPEFIKRLEEQGIDLTNEQRLGIYAKNWASIAKQKNLPGVNELTTEQPKTGWQKPTVPAVPALTTPPAGTQPKGYDIYGKPTGFEAIPEPSASDQINQLKLDIYNKIANGEITDITQLSPIQQGWLNIEGKSSSEILSDMKLVSWEKGQKSGYDILTDIEKRLISGDPTTADIIAKVLSGMGGVSGGLIDYSKMSKEELQKLVATGDSQAQAQLTKKGKTSTKYIIGQIISTSKGQYKVVGFDTDGEPLVEPVK